MPMCRWGALAQGEPENGLMRERIIKAAVSLLRMRRLGPFTSKVWSRRLWSAHRRRDQWPKPLSS